MMCLKRAEKKQLLGRYKKVVKCLFNYFKKTQKQPPEVLCKKAVLKSFAIFAGRK